jgi:uncharacterized protein
VSYERRNSPASYEATGSRVSGYAAVFERETTIHAPRPFQEVIRSGAFSWGEDVKLLWNHNPDLVLGSLKSGTLSLTQDAVGLRFSANLPESATREREALARGDVDGMSFAFTVRKEGTRSKTRVLEEIEVHEISITPFPAYSEAKCNLRSQNYARLELAERELAESRYVSAKENFSTGAK